MKPWIIAEAGVNHNGDMNLAYELIRQAKACGAQAVKFQNYKTELLAKEDTPKVPYQTLDAPEEVESHFEMLKKLEIDEEQTLQLKRCCDEEGIEFMSTPYDVQSLHYLKKIGCRHLKIASADLVDFQLQEAAQTSGLALIQSVGMSTREEIEQWNAWHQHNPSQRYLLQCTSNYPADPKNANLKAMVALAKLFGLEVGFSDHTPDERCAVLATALGASIIEKHFTLDKQLPGPDHKASATPGEFKAYVESIRECVVFLGSEQ